MRSRHAVVAVLVLRAALSVSAGEPRDPRPSERGYPLMRLYDESDHGGETQNFAVATDARGYVYVGNLHGLLISNGAQWRLAPSETALYAVAANASGEVLAGGPGSLATIEGAKDGSPTLRSIVDLLPSAERAFGDVRSIAATPGGFAILTDTRLLFYDGKALRTAAAFAPQRSASLLLFRDTAYLVRDTGLEKVGDGGQLTPAAEFALLRGRRVDALIEHDASSYFAVLRDMGLVRVSPSGLAPVDARASDWARANVVSATLSLRDGRIAFGSRTGGVLLASSNGETEQIIDSRRGLPDDQVTGLSQDRDGGLWVSLNAGLARLDVASAVTAFDARAGVLGGSQGVHRHAGRLYFLGSAGLGVIERGALRKIPGVTGSTWFGLNLPGREDDFLLAAASGVFRIAGDRAGLVPGTADIGAYVLARAATFDGIIVGARGGLYLLTPIASGYKVLGPLQGSPRYIRSIVVRATGRAFFSTVFDGIGAVDFDAANPSSARFQKLGGIEGDVHLSPDGPIAITSDEKSEIFRIDEKTPRLVRDEALTEALLGRNAWVSASDASGNLWVNTNPLRVFPRVNGSLSATPLVLHAFPARRTQVIRPEADGVVWVGGDGGLFRHVGPPGGDLPAPPAPILARVSVDDRVVFDGFDGKARPPEELPQDLRRLHLEFGPLSHQRGLAYQFRLDPLDSAWSEWSPRTDVEFTTLQEAKYRLRLRTRGADGQIGPETTWGFVVNPPWHRTLAARLFAFLGFVLFVGGAVWVRTRVLQGQAERLTLRVEERTRDLQAAVRDLQASRAQVEEQNRLLAAANAQLEVVSSHDALTGIANRRQFDTVLNEEWLRGRRRRSPMAVGILDLDHFKDLNDAFGHPQGDEALKQVAAALRSSLRRPADLIARYGGEEFAFILSDTDLQGALRVAEELRSRVEALCLENPGSASNHLTASVGLAVAIPGDGLTAALLIDAADRALYAVKEGGRNHVRGAEVGENGEPSSPPPAPG